MFEFFRKRNNIHKLDIALMKNIFSSLDEEFGYIKKQLDDGLMVGVKKSNKPVSFYTKFSYNNSLLNKLEDKSGRYFCVRGLSVFDSVTNKYVELQINIGYGILISYFPLNVDSFNPVIDEINTDEYKLVYFSDEKSNQILELLTEVERKLVNIDEIYEVQIRNKIYFHLKDIADGDFIGIDIDKNIYLIKHDPFEILLQKVDLIDLLKNK